MSLLFLSPMNRYGGGDAATPLMVLTIVSDARTCLQFFVNIVHV